MGADCDECEDGQVHLEGLSYPCPSCRAKPGSARWLAERRSGIGGSEVSALYRLPDGRCAHPWMTQTRLWAIKTGRVPDEQPDPWEAPQLYVGRVLEQPVREMYSLYSGRTVSDGVALLRDREAPVLLANTDGTQVCPERSDEPGVYEGKVTTVFRRRDWFERHESEAGNTYEVETTPLHYICQTQHYMACTGHRWASVVAFMQGDRAPIHWRDIEQHESFIGDMRERASRWWRDHVEADREPPVDDQRGTEDALREVYREAESFTVQLPAAFAGVFDRLDAIGALTAVLERERQRLRNMVLSSMGPAALAVIANDGRGWSLRGRSGRILRALTEASIARARRSADMMRPLFVSPALEAELDRIYTTNLMVMAGDTDMSAKGMHIAMMAVAAAKKASE